MYNLANEIDNKILIKFGDTGVLFCLLMAIAIAINVASYDWFNLRVSDFVVLFCFALLLLLDRLSVSYLELSLFISIFLILLVSDTASFVSGTFNISGALFYYKYFFIFVCFVFFKSIFQRYLWFSFKYFVYPFLVFYTSIVVWTLFSVFYLGDNYLDANGRPSFPLAKDYAQSDAHLLSAVIGIGLIFYFSILRDFFKKKLSYDFFMISFVPLSMLVTGSRSAFAIVFFFCFILFFIHIFRILINHVASRTFLLSVLTSLFFVLFSILAALYYSNYLLLSDFRALNFNLVADESSNIRIEMLLQAINESSKNGYLLGAGPTASDNVFYDGIFSILIAHGGFLLVLLVFTILALIFFKVVISRRISFNGKAKYISLVLSIFFANGISEYIFVTRAAIPMISIIVFSWFFLVSTKTEKFTKLA